MSLFDSSDLYPGPWGVSRKLYPARPASLVRAPTRGSLAPLVGGAVAFILAIVTLQILGVGAPADNTLDGLGQPQAPQAPQAPIPPVQPAPAPGPPSEPLVPEPEPEPEPAPAPAPEYAVLPDGYSYLKTVNGKPFLADACKPVTYEVDLSAAPAGSEAIVMEGVTQVSQMTGLAFVPQGSTSNGGLAITITFVSEADEPDLAGNRIGLSQNRTRTEGDTPIIFQSEILLEIEWFERANRREPEASRGLVMHELLHSLGLDHTNDISSLMYPTLIATTPSELDRIAMRALNRGCG